MNVNGDSIEGIAERSEIDRIPRESPAMRSDHLACDAEVPQAGFVRVRRNSVGAGGEYDMNVAKDVRGRFSSDTVDDVASASRNPSPSS